MERTGIEELHIFNQQKIPLGVDEVGRGCLAGPVCIGVVYIPKNVFDNQWQTFKQLGIDDSKRLTSLKRKYIISQLSQFRILYTVGFSSVKEINAQGIVGAVSTAIRRGFTALHALYYLVAHQSHVYFDGSIKPPGVITSYDIVVGGDRSIISISLASIIAKVSRDTYMETLHREFPHYFWDRNKGYGSLLHRQGLERYGLTPHHRKLFCRKYQLV